METTTPADFKPQRGVTFCVYVHSGPETGRIATFRSTAPANDYTATLRASGIRYSTAMVER